MILGLVRTAIEAPPRAQRSARRDAFAVALALLIALSLAATWSAYTGTDSTDANTAQAAANFRPVSTTPPTFTGTLREFQTLTADPGLWSGLPTGYVYQWQRRATGTSGAWTSISSATAQTYTLQTADIDMDIRVLVAAVNTSGTSTQTPSAQRGPVDPATPINQTAPLISGTPQSGQTLTANPGTWSGQPTFTYQWERCVSGDCRTVTGATSSSYTLPDELGGAGYTMRVVVTASNRAGTQAATSPETGTVVARAPTAGTPSISGSAVEDQTLTGSVGSWSNVASFAYQWQQNASGFWQDISGATASTLRVPTGYAGRSVRLRVRGTSAQGGTAEAFSAAVGQIAPRQYLAPRGNYYVVACQEVTSIDSGPATYRRNGAFTGTHNTNGNWNHLISCDGGTNEMIVGNRNVGAGQYAPSFAYGMWAAVAPSDARIETLIATQRVKNLNTQGAQWQAGITNGGSWLWCGALYTCDNPNTPSSGLNLSVQSQRVEMLNICGFTICAANADWYAFVALDDILLYLSDYANPAISQYAGSYGTLWGASGWQTGSRTLQFSASDNTGVRRMEILVDGRVWGEETPGCDYTQTTPCPTSSAIQRTINMSSLSDGQHTAAYRITDASGRSYYSGEQTFLADSTAPETVDDLHVREGSAWRSQSSYRVSWRQPRTDQGSGLNASTLEVCKLDSSGCFTQSAGLDGFEAISLPSSGEWRARVRYSDVAGNTASYSAWSSTMRYDQSAAAPVNTAAPDVTVAAGTTTGDDVTSTQGTWTTGPTPTTYARRWLRCDDATLASCAAIAGQTAASYTVTAADQGKRLRVEVTATNTWGASQPATSTPTAAFSLVPRNLTAPTLSTAAPRVGQALTVSDPGSWRANPTGYAYQWQRCDLQGAAGCSDIAGASAAAYTPTGADLGSTLRARVTASNAAGSSSAVSAQHSGDELTAPVLVTGAPTARFGTDGLTSALRRTSDGSTYVAGTFNAIGRWAQAGLVPSPGATGDLAAGTEARVDVGDGTVHAIEPDGSGGFFVGGDFTEVNGVARRNLARITAAGTLDTGWEATAMTSGVVRALARQGSRLIAGGQFTVGAGATQRSGLAAFAAADGTRTTISGIAAAESVLALKTMSDGSVAVGGDFASGTTDCTSAQTRHMTRLKTDGTTDCAWGARPNGAVHALDIDSDSSEGSGQPLIVGGAFTTAQIIGGSTFAAQRLFRGSTSDGTLGSPMTVNGTVRAITIDDANNAMWIGGDFTAFDWLGTTYPRARVMGLTTNGAPSSFNPGANGTVRALAHDGTRLAVGGDFTTLAGSERDHVGAVDAASGALDAWRPRVANDFPTWGLANAGIRALTPVAGKIAVGGREPMIAGTVAPNLARISASGAVTSPFGTPDSHVRALAVRGSTLYAVGDFTAVSGTARGRGAAFNLDTGTITSWNPQANASVTGVAAPGTGPIYLAGSFTSLGAASRGGLAATDASSGTATSWAPTGTAQFLTLGANDTSIIGLTTTGDATRRSPLDATALGAACGSGTVTALAVSSLHIACAKSASSRELRGADATLIASGSTTLNVPNPGTALRAGALWSNDGTRVLAEGRRSTATLSSDALTGGPTDSSTAAAINPAPVDVGANAIAAARPSAIVLWQAP